MFQILCKILLLATFVTSASCRMYQGFNADEKEPQIRIVDDKGHPKNIQMHTPQLNVEALSKQGKLTQEQIHNAYQPAQQQEIAHNKYASGVEESPITPAERELIRTLEMPTADSKPKEKPQEANIGIASNNLTPEEIEYDLGKEETVIATKTTSEKTVKAVKEPPKSTTGIFVQAGSFAEKTHAKKRLDLLQKRTGEKNGQITEAVVKGQNYHRVLFGPYPNKSQARVMIRKLSKHGHKSIIIKN